MSMGALKVAFGLTVAVSIFAGCADESQQAGIDGERGGAGDPGGGSSVPSSSAGGAERAWCKKHEWKGYKVFDGIQSVWVGAPDNVWIVISYLHTGFYGNDPTKGELGIQRYVPFLAHWNGQDLCIADAYPLVPIGFQGRRMGGTPNDLWLSAHGDGTLNKEQPIFHWDGVTWKQFSEDLRVDKFYALGPSDVYATGPKLHHWDGATWTEVTSPALGKITGYEMWPDRQGRIWIPPWIATDNQNCLVAVLSPAGPTWNGSCVLERAGSNFPFRIAGIGEHPWVTQLERTDTIVGDRVVHLEDDGWTEAFNGGSSARCSQLYSSGERVVCIADEGRYMWTAGQEEATTIVTPPKCWLDPEQIRDDLWALTTSEVFRSTDGQNWTLVVSLR